jgi:N-acetylglucosamine-6-phosphate deacetylase
MDPNLPDGVYPWRDGSINKCGSRITLEGTDTLAGSAVSLDECVRNLSTFASIPLSQAILCASTNAAKSLGEAVSSRKGTLGVGFDADLSVWDRQTGQVKAAWVAGKLAFSK